MYIPKFPLPIFGRRDQSGHEFLRESQDRPIYWTNPLEGLTPQQYESLLGRKNVLGAIVDNTAFAFAAKDAAAQIGTANFGLDPSKIELALVTDELLARRVELIASLAVSAANQERPAA